MTAATDGPLPQHALPQQLIKWTIYLLLLANWVFYAWDEWRMAQHTLREGGTLLEWAGAFATTIDEGAWFGLLFLWELETYWLPYDWQHRHRWLQRAMLAMRLVCYVFILHTVYARVVDYTDLNDLPPIAGVTDPCQLTGDNLSWTYNLDYTLIDGTSCAALPDGERYYAVEPTAVTGEAGLAHERIRRWIDLQDAVTWLLVMFTIELAIWLQERDITGGPLMVVSFAGKALYGLLFLHAGYWAWQGHWVYAWDQVLWIGGFFAIELNVRDWRAELEEEDDEDPGDHEGQPSKRADATPG